MCYNHVLLSILCSLSTSLTKHITLFTFEFSLVRTFMTWKHSQYLCGMHVNEYACMVYISGGIQVFHSQDGLLNYAHSFLWDHKWHLKAVLCHFWKSVLRTWDMVANWRKVITLFIFSHHYNNFPEKKNNVNKKEFMLCQNSSWWSKHEEIHGSLLLSTYTLYFSNSKNKMIGSKSRLHYNPEGPFTCEHLFLHTPLSEVSATFQSTLSTRNQVFKILDFAEYFIFNHNNKIYKYWTI